MWKEKKFVVEIDEKYVDQKNHQMLTYIIGKAYDKQNCQALIAPKKLFSRLGKKRVCKQQKL